MNEPANPFSAQLLLLIVDKLIIGAIIAVAFFCYDRYKTTESRKYQEQQQQIQLRFEQSRLLKEFLPIIQDSSVDLVTRGYVLRSAVLSRALDAAAAFEIGQDFLRAGLQENHYKRVVSVMLPDSIGAFSTRGTQIAREWREALGSFPFLRAHFDPVSGVENLPPALAPFVTEGRLLGDVVYENLGGFAGCACPDLTDEQFPAHLPGLFVLLLTPDRQRVDELVRTGQKNLELLGRVIRLWQQGEGARESESYLESELRAALDSPTAMRRATALVDILGWVSVEEGGLRSSAFSGLLARVATGSLFPRSSVAAAVEEGPLYWLRWTAAEALLGAPDVSEAVPIIQDHLRAFAADVSRADGREQLRRVSTEYESGKIVRVLVSVLGSAPGADLSILHKLLDLGQDVLPDFPFLASDLKRALGQGS